MHHGFPGVEAMSSRSHLALDPGALDRLARLACSVTGAPAALVLRTIERACEEGWFAPDP